MKYFPNATRCIDFFHVVQWVNKALDDVRISVAAKAKQEYNNLKNKYIQSEKAVKETDQIYQDTLNELSKMQNRGRPSARKRELISFVEQYKAVQVQVLKKDQIKRVGRPKKEQLSPEHEASLKELKERIKIFKGAKFALGHNPENCTARQIEKLQIIENNSPNLYRAYQLKESLRIILHMKDKNLAIIELNKWIKEAKNSGLNPMKELAEKIENRHYEKYSKCNNVSSKQF